MGVQISQAEYDAMVKKGLLQPHVNFGHRTNTPGRVLLTILGAPIGKPRMTQRDKWAQRPCVLRYREWCDRVRAVAGTVPSADRVAMVEIWAYFTPPESWSKQRRCDWVGTKHRVRPDFDNIAKALVDALWKEDSGIADASVHKRWSWDARLEVAIVREHSNDTQEN